MGAHIRFDDDGSEQNVKTPIHPFNTTPTKRPSNPKPNASSSRVLKAEVQIKKSSKNKRHLSRRANGAHKAKSTKNQARTIQRLLNNKGNELAPCARKEKEEELKQLRRVCDEHDRRELERKMVERYRMIRFFERRKLERILGKIVKNGSRAEDAEQKKQVLRDLRYVTEYPKDKKYIALFPSEGHTEESLQRVEEMRKEIEGGLMKQNAGEIDTLSTGPKSEQQVSAERDDFFVNDESD